MLFAVFNALIVPLIVLAWAFLGWRSARIRFEKWKGVAAYLVARCPRHTITYSWQGVEIYIEDNCINFFNIYAIDYEYIDACLRTYMPSD